MFHQTGKKKPLFPKGDSAMTQAIDLDGVHLIDSEFNAVRMPYKAKTQAEIAQHER